MSFSSSAVKPATLDLVNKASSFLVEPDVLNKYVRLIGQKDNDKAIIHLHCCRSGPILANEIFISINEKKKRPELKKIYGIVQPGGTVSKYLMYWYGGLDEKYLFYFFDNIKFVNNKKVSSEILFLSPNDVMVTWGNGIKVMVEPLIKNEANIFLEILKLTEEQSLKKIYYLHPENEVMSLKVFLESVSLFLANSVLNEKGLPEIFLIAADSFIDPANIEVKYIDNLLGDDLLNKKRIKDIRIMQHAVNEIKKKLKGYLNYDDKQLGKVFNILFKKNNRAVSKNFLTLEKFEDIFIKYKSKDDIFYENIIFRDLLNSNNILSRLIKSQGANKYISGKDMIEICFNAANVYKIPVILQKFFREGGYNRYSMMLKKYPNVSTDKSSIDIWNTNIFPEYDLNIFKGMKYLK